MQIPAFGKILSASIFLAITIPAHAGNSPGKETADFYLTDPQKYKGHDITLHVAAVKPVEFESPIPQVQFFRAMTFDLKNHSPGGEIMIAVPASENTKFVKK